MTVKQSVFSFISILAVLFVVVQMALVGWISWLLPWAHQPLELTETPVLQVESGYGVQRVANILRARGHLPQDAAAVWYARLTQSTAIQKGQYRLENGMSWAQILDNLRHGRVIEYSVTFVEGWSLRQILSHLHAQPFVKKTIEWERGPVMAEGVAWSYHPNPLSGEVEPSAALEGLFYASTYLYTAGDTDREVLHRANRRLGQELDQLWAQRVEKLPYASPYEALIMASLVEKETGVAEERARIAGVFVRRLRKNMRLQTDPTVIYGVGESFDGNLTRKHLRTPTPYNTYTIKGLPPTPIASVGRAALEAALQPDLSDDALYFVGKGDGTHYFSATLKEHNQAVQRFQIRQRSENYQSSPPP